MCDMEANRKEGTKVHTYFVDRIDDEAETIASETIQAANNEAAKNEARAICRDKGWDAAEVWDKEQDVHIADVRP